MSENVKPMRAVKPKAIPEVVGLLKDLLTLAEEGKVRSLVFASENQQGQVVTGRSIETCENLFGLIGAVDYCKLRLLDYIQAIVDAEAEEP